MSFPLFQNCAKPKDPSWKMTTPMTRLFKTFTLTVLLFGSRCFGQQLDWGLQSGGAFNLWSQNPSVGTFLLVKPQAWGPSAFWLDVLIADIKHNNQYGGSITQGHFSPAIALFLSESPTQQLGLLFGIGAYMEKTKIVEGLNAGFIARWRLGKHFHMGSTLRFHNPSSRPDFLTFLVNFGLSFDGKASTNPCD